MPPWTLEAAATAATVAGVLLTVRRSLWQYPVGIVATLLFLLVFLEARLYGSMVLQVVFVGVQIYGWWFWLRGDDGGRPAIRLWGPRAIGLTLVIACVGALVAGYALDGLTDAATPLADGFILGLSLAAQVLLDRKVAQHWFIWMAVDVLSIVVYASRGLELTTLLYAALLLNAVFGWWIWRRRLGERIAGETAA